MSAKKPLTPEQREKKNAAARARRAKAAKPAKAKKPAPKKAAKTPAKTVSVKLPNTGGKKVVVENVQKIAQNGFTRPKPTHADGRPKLTHRVWQIADEISAKHAADAKAESQRTRKKVEAKPATRKEVLAVCEAENIKYSTFSNQFYRWRKFNGLFGRVRKDGVLAAVTGGPRAGANAGRPPKNKGKPAPKKAAPKAKTPPKVKKPAKSKPKAKKPPLPVVATKPVAPAPVQSVLPFPVATAPASAAVAG